MLVAVTSQKSRLRVWVVRAVTVLIVVWDCEGRPPDILLHEALKALSNLGTHWNGTSGH